ncbi:MAG: carboxymuconolactone decarboxylase family protein [Methanolinea sp.]|jgi:alkylhydroperoxidase/carboxymuconolactone decarboxylase family protein YurZ|nr:carboxymuconolactone decarboxylase family protein [Methanolinea sp.]
MEQNPMELFLREAPEVAHAFDNLVEAIRKGDWTDAKTKQLLNIAIQTAQRNPRGVFFHAGMARDAGARREEVVGAVVMNLHLSGLGPVLDCLPAAVQGYERESGGI